MTQKNRKIIGIALLAVLAGALIYLTVRFMPWIVSLKDEENRTAFKELIDSMGAGGWFILLGVQILQIIVAVLPGEPIEVIAGYLYGTFGGLLTCLLGILIGSLLVFYLVRLLKHRFITLFISQEKLDGYRFLKDTPRLEGVVFILFLIPGTPKDVLTYVAGLTTIRPLRFFMIAAFARIPSVITSTWAGASIYDGNWMLTAVIFAVTAVIGLLGIWFNKKYQQKLNGKNS